MTGFPVTLRGDRDRDKDGGKIAWVGNCVRGGKKGW